uniref:Uncharacterized protein n=1 Tax=uncultured Bacillota bacterium TaxID=344338 RepID=A0A650ENG4_9FIRM|nr:hypothetical protein Firmicute1046_2420 [uncultured Firmicutes bacterium]
MNSAEEYEAAERLKPEYLTKEKDILIRLSAPYTAVYITDSSQCGYPLEPSRKKIWRYIKGGVNIPFMVISFI